jgi:hypothetical protein
VPRPRRTSRRLAGNPYRPHSKGGGSPARGPAGDVREEGIAVGAEPGTVGIRIGVVRHRGAHLPDALINTRTAPVEQDLRPSPEPVIVQSHPVDAHRRSAIGDTKPEDLIASKAGRSGRFYRNPGMDRRKCRATTRPGRQTLESPLAGSGERPVGSRRAWRHGTPPRGSGRQKLTSRGPDTRRAEATRGPTRDRHLSGTVGS